MNLLYTLEDLQAIAQKRLVAIEILEERVDALLITIARKTDELNRTKAYTTELLDKLMEME